MTTSQRLDPMETLSYTGGFVLGGYEGTLTFWMDELLVRVQIICIERYSTCTQQTYQRLLITNLSLYSLLKPILTYSRQCTTIWSHDVMWALYSLTSTECDVDGTLVKDSNVSWEALCGMENGQMLRNVSQNDRGLKTLKYKINCIKSK